MFFGEVTSSIPDIAKEECDNWDMAKGLLDSRIAVLNEYKDSETTQKTEFEASKQELETEKAEAYPCQQPLMCTVVGETFYGDKNRHICNIIEEEETEDEDCR